MRFVQMVVLALVLPSATWAGTCRFTTECFEAEPCAATDFTVMIEPGGGADRIRLVTQSETLNATLGGTADFALVLAQGASALHVISLNAEGDARYTLHMQGPMMVGYQGQCEGLG